MADHTVTIKTGCALDPQTIGGSSDPIFTGDVVTFANQAGVSCILRFSPPSPFGQPTINVSFPGTESRRVTGVVHSQTNFPYTCTPSTGALAPAAASATSSLGTPADSGDGIIIVDPPGGGGPAAVATTAPKATAKGKAAKKPKRKAVSKTKSKSKSRGRAKAKPKTKAKTRGKSKARPKKKH